MGAYLSTPLTDKDSSDETNEYLSCGASQMQGWRMSQEDAHICALDFDVDTSLFAVFDGHGGSEVALYCSQKLPDFLKNVDAYKKGDFDQALKDAFIGFDATLVNEQVIEELKKLIPDDKQDGETETEEDGDDDEENLSELCQESRMPLNELLEKLKDGKNPILKKLKQGESSGSKPLSPFLRGRRNGSKTSENGESSAAAVSSAITARKIDVHGSGDEEDENEAVSSSSATGSGAKKSEIEATPANEASSSGSSSSASCTSVSVLAGSWSDANIGPSSSSNNINSESDEKNHCNSTTIKFESGEKNSCNSPDSSSTTNKTADQHQKEQTVESCTSLSSEANTINADKQAVNGSSEKKTASQVSESVSSSSSSGSSASNENGVVSSNATETGGQVDKSQDKISSTKSLPVLDGMDDDEDLSSSEEEDGSYNESECTNEDGEECEMETSENDEDESDDDELCPNEYDEDEKFLNQMFEGPGSSSGCTAVVALLRGNELFVANAGDSRCVVCRDGKAVDMSLDHKPEDTEELERIRKAGGRVTMDGRVNGGLNLSRAIGDHAYKTNKDLKAEEQMISALPDIKRATITAKDEFMILACDGIWNSLSSEDVVDFVRTRIQKGETKMSAICEELFTKCLAPNTSGDGTGCDNMTAVIIQFKPLLSQRFRNSNESNNSVAVTTTDAVTENVIAAKKRTASPTPVDNAANTESCKRFKTDDPADTKNSVVTATANPTST